MPVSLGMGTGRDMELARSLQMLKERLSLGQGRKSCKWRSSPLMPASNVLQGSLSWTLTFFCLVPPQCG